MKEECSCLGEKLFILGQELDMEDWQLDVYHRLTIQEILANELRNYHLTVADMVIITMAWYKVVDEDNKHFYTMGILDRLPMTNRAEIFRRIERVAKLVQKGIFDCTSDSLKLLQFGAEFPIEQLLDNPLVFSAGFLRLLLNKHNRPVNSRVGYKNNHEFLADWFAYLQLIEETYEAVPLSFEKGKKWCNETREQARLYWNRIQRKLKNTKKIIPFQQIVAEFHLNQKEQIILMHILKAGLENTSPSIWDCACLVSDTKFDVYRNLHYFDASARLVQNSLVELYDQKPFQCYPVVELRPVIRDRILNESDITTDDYLTELVSQSNLLTLVEPQCRLEDLILAADIKNTLLASLKLFNSRVNQTLRKWSVLDNQQGKTNASLLLLFHGKPGTGKTFAAHAVAAYLGKKIVTTDIARILSCYIGESEKNVRELFSLYNQITRKVVNPPVLLLNEADQFLARRFEASRSVDRMYNQMQNLFLEAFENLQGMVICTSNLCENFDPAFSRRFHLKLEFPLPGLKEREQLWKLYLKDSIPGAREIDTNYFAQQYELSGGQIALIIKNAAIRAAARCGKERRILPADLEHYCRLEEGTMFESRHKAIGFIQ